jgi:hypothetical protein
MTSFQKSGGISALIAAATYLAGFALLFTLLSPSGYGSDHADPMKIVEFSVAKPAIMYAWNLTIYVINGIALVVLALALHDRLKSSAPELARIATAFGVIWAGLVIASGMVANVGIGAVAEVYATDPDQAAVLWTTLSAVENGLGGGNEIVGGIWVLLLSWAGLRTGAIPKLLNFLGLLIGVSGLLTIIPALEVFGAIFGLGFIVWFIWTGIVMLRSPTTA